MLKRLKRGMAGDRLDLFGAQRVGFALLPSDYATKKTELQKGTMILFPVKYEPSYAYSSKEIDNFAEHFERLTREGSAISLALFGHLLKKENS